MDKGPKTTKLFMIGIVVLLTTVFLFSQTFALSKPSVKKGEAGNQDINSGTGQYISPIEKTDFKFNVFGLAWQGDPESQIELRYKDSSGWSKWYAIEFFTKKDGWNYSTDPFLADEGTELQYKIKSSQNVSRAKFIYLGNSSESNFNNWSFLEMFSKAQAADDVSVISRSEWEADEDWRLNGNGQEVWPVAYQLPEKFVIHHTAGATGGNNSKGTIRGIYYWHAVVLGWGDIGYNYLIDQNGNIYEGRTGGDGAIGAHAYRTKTCAVSRFNGAQYEADFNKGTIGISVLGDYENSVTLNNKVKNALADLIASKGKEFRIEPVGESFMVDNTYPNIIGHKDVDCTACPGTNLYKKLGEIRNLSQQKYEELKGVADPIIKAAYLRPSEQPVTITGGEEKEFWVEFKNEGNVTWHSFGLHQPKVVVSSQSILQGSDWNSKTQVATLESSNVEPGKTGRFIFKLKAPLDRLETSENFLLSFDDQIKNDTEFKVNVNITGLPYAAELADRTVNQAMFLNDTQTVTMKYRNKGTETWEKGKIKLNVYDVGEKNSRLASQDWPNNFGQINFKEKKVAPEEIATFAFKLKAPPELGIFKNFYRLMGESNIVQEENFSITRIDSTYQAELISHNIPLAMLSYWRIPVTVKFKNKGLGFWNKSMVLNICDLGEKVSKFQDTSWSHQSGQFVLKEKEVKPGETGTFELFLKAPLKVGLYLQILKLGIPGKEVIVQNGNFSVLTRIDN